MGLHKKTLDIIQDKDKLKRLLEHLELFGPKSTMGSYGIGDSALKSIIKFVEKHTNYLEEDKSEQNN